MTLFTTLAVLAGLFFVAHVILLFTSFGKSSYQKGRYFYSHLTLWISGALLFMIALLYSGKEVSPVLDVFDTIGKQALILGVVVVLSLVAHTIVRTFIIPRYK